MLDWNEVEYKKSQIGGRRDFFHRPTAMLNNFEMHVSTLNEGLTNHPAHTHGAEEFVVMINGDVVMLIGAENYECSTGDVIFLSSMTPHSLNNSGTGETIYFAFQFWQ
jgi:(S)-ureidoglycine aminohydrolase